MKRFLPLVALIGLCCLAVPLLMASGGEKSDSNRHYPPQMPGVCGAGPGGGSASTLPDSSSIDTEVVQDLTTILKETTSRETFAYTVIVLGKMGRTARPALPAIIRNAERLRLFTSNARGSEDYVAAMTDAIECILEKKSTTTSHVSCRPAAAIDVSAPTPSPTRSEPRLVPVPAR